MNELRLQAERHLLFRRVAFYLVKHIGEGKIALSEPVVMKEVDPLLQYNDPTFSLDDEACQQLITELWNMGYRPSSVRAIDDIVEAKDQHLTDLRQSNISLTSMIEKLIDKVE